MTLLIFLDRPMWTPTLSSSLTHRRLRWCITPRRRLLCRVNPQRTPPRCICTLVQGKGSGTCCGRAHGALPPEPRIWISSPQLRRAHRRAHAGQVEQWWSKRDEPSRSCIGRRVVRLPCLFLRIYKLYLAVGLWQVQRDSGLVSVSYESGFGVLVPATTRHGSWCVFHSEVILYATTSL